jgi:hypothetical protein
VYGRSSGLESVGCVGRLIEGRRKVLQASDWEGQTRLAVRCLVERLLCWDGAELKKLGTMPRRAARNVPGLSHTSNTAVKIRNVVRLESLTLAVRSLSSTAKSQCDDDVAVVNGIH